MLNESNPEEDDDINQKIIHVLNTEIQRLSKKDQPSKSNDKTHHKAQLVRTSTIEQELQDVAGYINEAGRIIVLVGAGISTNCGIPVSNYLHDSPPQNNRLA